jgi:hypothetical protein
MANGSVDFSNLRNRAKVTTKTGFAQPEVIRLMSQGDNLSSSNFSEKASKPKMKKRQTIKRIGKDPYVYHAGTNYLGKFSGASKEEVDRLMERFSARRQFISTKKQRPGITQLMSKGM